MYKDILWEPLIQATKETLYMTFVTLVFVIIIGFVIGYVMYQTDMKKGYKKMINQFLVAATNVARSMPFLILMILIMPFTKQLRLALILGRS